MKISFMQFAPVLGDVQATVARIERLSPHCAGADLLVLPELCNSGYNFTSAEQAWESAEEVGDGLFLRYLASLCRRHGFHIVSGLNERDGDHLYNSAVLIGPGGYVGRYRKLHLFLNEKDYFQPGDGGLPVFDIGPCTVGLLVRSNVSQEKNGDPAQLKKKLFATTRVSSCQFSVQDTTNDEKSCHMACSSNQSINYPSS
jgi:predicted amidohydrolase